MDLELLACTFLVIKEEQICCSQERCHFWPYCENTFPNINAIPHTHTVHYRNEQE